MDMDGAIWSLLPSELVENVLSFTSTLDLYRYRSVCRKWNLLFCSPIFAKLHAENGKHRGTSFIAMEMQGLKPLTWCILDLNARRWYTFRNDKNIIACHNHFYLGSGVAAMNGGLICQFAKTEPTMLSIFVHDLFGHTVKSLPLIKRHSTSQTLPLVHMVVDNTSHHFTIFLLNQGFNLDNSLVPPDLIFQEQLKIMNNPLIHIYDSATNKWRSASNPQDHGLYYNFVSMVMCQGLLYALMARLDHWIAYYYNPAEDAWKLTNFYLSEHDTHNPRLIAINTRLFVASWKFHSKGPRGSRKYDLEVSEIIIPQMTLKTLFRLPMPDLMELLEVKTRNFDLIDTEGWYFPEYVEVNVSGVENALFVQSRLSRKAKVFDLDTCSWDHGIPEHPLQHLCFGRGPNKIAKQMNLLLPNSLQYLI